MMSLIVHLWSFPNDIWTIYLTAMTVTALLHAGQPVLVKEIKERQLKVGTV